MSSDSGAGDRASSPVATTEAPARSSSPVSTPSSSLDAEKMRHSSNSSPGAPSPGVKVHTISPLPLAPPPAHTKPSNFSISSILSRDSDSKRKPPPTPEDLERPREGIDRKPSEPSRPELPEGLRIDTHMAAALAQFHPGLNPAFLERPLAGKPTPWYPWFHAGPYLPFPFDSKYSIVNVLQREF